MKSFRKQIESLDGISDLQRVQLRIEVLKAWGTMVAIFVPLCVAAATLIVSIVLANARARVDFELKAAEIVMNASSPVAAANKAAVLVELFPTQLQARFPETLRRLYDEADATSQPRK